MDTMQRYLAQERADYGGGATMLADAPPTVPNPFLAPVITFSGGWVDVTGGPFPLRGYLARPDGVAPGLGGQARPAVVVVPHAGRGLVPYGRDIAEALASAGYIALAMDMLSGHGGAEQYDNDQEQLMDALSAISAEDHTAGLLAAVAHLQGRDEVSGVGAMGFLPRWGAGLAANHPLPRPEGFYHLLRLQPAAGGDPAGAGGHPLAVRGERRPDQPGHPGAGRGAATGGDDPRHSLLPRHRPRLPEPLEPAALPSGGGAGGLAGRDRVARPALEGGGIVKLGTLPAPHPFCKR